MNHVLQVSALPNHHRDPFDRILIAQSQVEEMPILTADDLIAQYSVKLSGKLYPAIDREFKAQSPSLGFSSATEFGATHYELRSTANRQHHKCPAVSSTASGGFQLFSR